MALRSRHSGLPIRFRRLTMIASVPRNARRSILIACLAAFLAAGSAQAGTLRGPATVKPGHRYYWTLPGFSSDTRFGITIQPRRFAGSNCCGRAVNLLFRTNSFGQLHFSFVFPRKYAVCGGFNSCSFRLWPRGERSTIYIDSSDGSDSARRTVYVR